MLQLVLCLLVAAALIPSAENRFMLQEGIFLGALSLFVLMGFQMKFRNWPLTLLILGASWYGIYQWIFPFIAFPDIGTTGAAMFGSCVLGAIFVLQALMFTACILPNEWPKSLIGLLFLMAALDAGVVLYFGFLNREPYFICNNPAQDACFMACLLPHGFGYLIDGHYRKSAGFLVCLISLSILVTLSSTGCAAMVIALFSFLWFRSAQKFKWFAISALGGALSFALFWLYLGHEWLNDNGRYHFMWGPTLGFITKSPWWIKLIGLGPGTFFLYGPTIQLANSDPTQFHQAFFWLHNEWFQLDFELGIVGLIMGAGAYLLAVKRAVLAEHFAMLVTLGFVAFFQPLRIFPFEFFGMVLFSAVLV